MEPEIGQQILHYRVLEKLGQGGMGSVFLAEDTKLNRKVALKFLPAEMTTDPERLKRFEREAKTVASLNHPNIVTIYSVEEAEGVPFIAMELVDGDVLSQLIPKGGLPLEQFFELAVPIADAVSTAHAKGITHRDLKPGNIMVGRDGRVKILDFGLAKLLEDSEAADASTLATQTLTKTGSAMGTVTYMAPEQLKGKPPDQRADIFSLGVVFYQMASGQRPFQGETSAEVISSILRDSPPPVTDHKLEVPSHLGRIVNRCLEKSPSRRYQQAADLCTELIELKREIDAGNVFEEEAKTRAIQVERRSRRWSFLAGLIVVGLVVFLIAFFTSRDRARERRVPASVANAARGPTFAVLPFAAVGTQADPAFADGLNEQVSSLITTLPDVQVVSRATAAQSFSPDSSTREIGDALAVDYLVLGTVRSGTDGVQGPTVRANLELVRVADDIQVWSESYDRESTNVLAVQSEVAQAAVSAIGVEVLGIDEQALPAALALEPATDEPVVADPPTPRTGSPEIAPAPTPPISTVTRIEERPSEEMPLPKPRPASLELQLTTFSPAGVLTIYADDLQVLMREFRFEPRKRGLLGRKKVAGSLTERLEVSPDLDSIRVYLLIDGESQLVRLEPELTPDRTYRLEVLLNRKGELEAALE